MQRRPWDDATEADARTLGPAQGSASGGSKARGKDRPLAEAWEAVRDRALEKD